MTKGDYTKERERASCESMSPERWKFIQNGYEESSPAPSLVGFWDWFTSWVGLKRWQGAESGVGQELRMGLERI